MWITLIWGVIGDRLRSDAWEQLAPLAQSSQYGDRTAIAVDARGVETTMNDIHLHFNMAERSTVNPPAKTFPTSTFPPQIRERRLQMCFAVALRATIAYRSVLCPAWRYDHTTKPFHATN